MGWVSLTNFAGLYFNVCFFLEWFGLKLNLSSSVTGRFVGVYGQAGFATGRDSPPFVGWEGISRIANPLTIL